MILTWQEVKAIAFEPQIKCHICDKILDNIICHRPETPEISDKYLDDNKDIKEHLRQIIGR